MADVVHTAEGDDTTVAEDESPFSFLKKDWLGSRRLLDVGESFARNLVRDQVESQIDSTVLGPIGDEIDDRINQLDRLDPNYQTKKDAYLDAKATLADWGEQAAQRVETLLFDQVAEKIDFIVPDSEEPERPLPGALQNILEDAASLVSGSLSLQPQFDVSDLISSQEFRDALNAVESGSFDPLMDLIEEPANYATGFSISADRLTWTSDISNNGAAET